MHIRHHQALRSLFFSFSLLFIAPFFSLQIIKFIAGNRLWFSIRSSSWVGERSKHLVVVAVVAVWLHQLSTLMAVLLRCAMMSTCRLERWGDRSPRCSLPSITNLWLQLPSGNRVRFQLKYHTYAECEGGCFVCFVSVCFVCVCPIGGLFYLQQQNGPPNG